MEKQYFGTDKNGNEIFKYTLTDEKGNRHWGVGIHDDIITASIKALFAAINQMLA